VKNLEFDKETGKFIKREEISIDDSTDVGEIRQALKIELAGIIRQVKRLKRRANEIKEMLIKIDESEDAKSADITT